MRASFVAFAATFIGLTVAQLEGLPTCAQTCVTGFTSGSNIGDCPSLDVHCICSSSTFLNSIACCLAGKCNAADQASAVKFAQQICKTADVTVPDQVKCVSSDLPSSTAPASSSSSSTGSAAAATTSSSSTSASTASTSSSSSSSSASSTSSTSSTSSSSSSASPSATKNAAIHNAASAGMNVVGGMAALMALL